MKLILHVGMAKTGTSTLQHALLANPKSLARLGAVYPRPMAGRSNHGYLTVLCVEPDRFPREFVQGTTTVDEAITRATTFWNHVRRQLEESRAETAILSAEYFFGLGDESVGRLRDLLVPHFDEVEVVAYVREPSAYYLSMMQQRVKGAAGLRSPSAFQSRVRVCIPRLASAFGGTVTVRAFDRAALVDGDIVTDFLTSVLSVSPDVRAEMKVDDRNTSMSAEAMCILQSVRRHGFPDDEGRFQPEVDLLMSRLEDARAPMGQSAPRLRPELAAAIVRRHLPDLAYLAEEFDIRFTDLVAPLPADAEDPAGWTSTDLTEILDLPPPQVERVTALLLKELAATAIDVGRPRRALLAWLRRGESAG